MKSNKIRVNILIFTILYNLGYETNVQHKSNAEVTDKHLLTFNPQQYYIRFNTLQTFQNYLLQYKMCCVDPYVLCRQ